MTPPSKSKTGSPRTLSIGGATFDVFVKADQSSITEDKGKKMFSFPLGEKIRVDDVVGTVGGGASNTSVGLARLGCQASFCGVIGDDQWGSALMENFRNEGVDTALATIVEEESTSFSLVLLSHMGERVILTHPGTGRHLQDATFDRDAAANVDAIYLNHIHAESCVIEDDLIDILERHQHIQLMWNPGGRQTGAGLSDEHNKKLLEHTAILFVNKEEALELSGRQSIKEALDTLSRAGAIIVCITDGPNGSYATDGKVTLHCPVVPCEVVDAAGAGDAFGTGVTWSILNGQDLPNALRTGTINAMSVVGVIGAQDGLLTYAAMQEKLTELTPSLQVTTF